MVKVELIWLLFPLLAICNQQCNQMISNWLSHPSSLPPEVYMNSGKFINDLGDYNNCIFNGEKYSYLTFRFRNILIGYQYIGFCTPNQCRDQIVDNVYSKIVQDNLNTMYKNKTNSTIDIFFDALFYQPINTPPVMDWSNYCTMVVLLVIVVIGVVSSIVSKISKKDTKMVGILKCFSFVDNFEKIINFSKNNQNKNLFFLNGMRVLSLFWIVFAHDMWFRFMNIKNWIQTIDILTTPGIVTLVPAAYFAVDTFFWIGGFLVTIGLLQQMQKMVKFIPFYLTCIVHRLIRIWPTYILAILIFWKVAPYVSNGPIWLSFSITSSHCNGGGFLWNMLFLDNFTNHGPFGLDYCFGWGWYLAVDFQLFIITPLIVYVFHRNNKIGWIVTFLLLFASVICAFVLIMVKNWRYPIPTPHTKPQPQFLDGFYYKPYVRGSAYFMGILSGFLYYQWKSGHQKTTLCINYIKRSIPLRISFYLIGITLCELTIWIVVPYQTGQQQWSKLAHAFYNSLNRVGFLIGVYLCVFAAMFGCQNDPSKFILGHRMFSPLARVSFCIYLMHFIVIMGGTYGNKMDLYWTPYTAIYLSIADIFWSVLAGTALSLLIQSPTLGLQKLFFRKAKKQKIKQQQNKNETNVKAKFIDFQNQSISYSSRSSQISQITSVDSAEIESQKSGELA